MLKGPQPPNGLGTGRWGTRRGPWPPAMGVQGGQAVQQGPPPRLGTPGPTGYLVGEVALAGHGWEPQDSLQRLPHRQPGGQLQRAQGGGHPLQHELLRRGGASPWGASSQLGVSIPTG